jgi:hypothetical protein
VQPPPEVSGQVRDPGEVVDDPGIRAAGRAGHGNHVAGVALVSQRD